MIWALSAEPGPWTSTWTATSVGALWSVPPAESTPPATAWALLTVYVPTPPKPVTTPVTYVPSRTPTPNTSAPTTISPQSTAETVRTSPAIEPVNLTSSDSLTLVSIRRRLNGQNTTKSAPLGSTTRFVWPRTTSTPAGRTPTR